MTRARSFCVRMAVRAGWALVVAVVSSYARAWYCASSVRGPDLIEYARRHGVHEEARPGHDSRSSLGYPGLLAVHAAAPDRARHRKDRVRPGRALAARL